jgi:hypothetical protein
MQLGEFPMSGKHASKQVTSKIQLSEHLRYCHLELILLIILFLGGMFAQTSSILS